MTIAMIDMSMSPESEGLKVKYRSMPNNMLGSMS